MSGFEFLESWIEIWDFKSWDLVVGDVGYDVCVFDERIVGIVFVLEGIGWVREDGCRVDLIEGSGNIFIVVVVEEIILSICYELIYVDIVFVRWCGVF